MRRYSVLFSLLCSPLLFLQACGTTDPPSTRNTMTSIVNSTGWNAIEMTAQKQNGSITIEGISAIDTRLVLKLRGDTVGTYPLGTIVNEAVFSDGPSQWVAFGVNSGSVTVTLADSTRVVGHFGFRGKDTTGIEQPREIASGTFDIDLAP